VREVAGQPGATSADAARQVVDELGAARAAARPAAAPAESADAPLVLVVEDNPDMRAFVRDSLAPDFRVEESANGREGLERALALRPDVILSDVMMPEMSGDQLLHELRSRSEMDDVPVVVLSARADEAVRVRLLVEGAQDYLSKPFSVEELRARVGNLAAMRRARGVLQAELATQSQDVAAMAAELAARGRDLRAALEAAEESGRLKDEFLATVSHELRTPLNAILGWVLMLRSGALDGETTGRGMETVERNVRLLSRLVGDLLDVSRVATGQLRLDVRPVDLRDVVDAAVDVVRPAIAARSIELRTALDPEVGAVVGDAVRLQQVVWNLLSNAVKFTPEGGRVDVRLDRVDSHVEISISDTGSGIRPEFLPFVFEPFRQQDGSITRIHGGLGLGLAIVRRLVELHGGTVRAESAGEGQGARFTVVLPLQLDGVEGQ
jgi:signal transduction histidine kinase